MNYRRRSDLVCRVLQIPIAGLPTMGELANSSSLGAFEIPRVPLARLGPIESGFAVGVPTIGLALGGIGNKRKRPAHRRDRGTQNKGSFS